MAWSDYCRIIIDPVAFAAGDGQARNALATKAAQVGDLLCGFNALGPGSRQG